MPGIYSLLAESIKANKPVALATALTPTLLGAKMLLHGGVDTQSNGSIHPDLDARIAHDTLAMLAEARNGTLTYELEGEPVSVFVETYPPPRRLIIIG